MKIPHSSLRSRGFTLIELLVVVAIIALLIAILIPSLGRAKELANRAACGANLSGIGKAFNLYGAEQSDTYPTVLAPATPGLLPAGSTTQNKLVLTGTTSTNATTDSALNAYYGSGTAIADAGDELANLWMLVLKGTVSTKSFICKSDPASPAAAQLTTSSNYYDNFNTNGQVGTSVSYGFSYAWNGTNVAAYWRNSIDASLPIGADVGQQTLGVYLPAVAGTAKVGNSQNHTGGEGQNVVWGDAHVSFEKGNNVGQQGDDIYASTTSTTINGGTNTGCPTGGGTVVTPGSASTGAFDTIMVPARNGTGW